MNNKIIVLAGFSGAGKDTLAKILQQVGFNFVVSHSTRPMRAEESEGNPYFFIDNNTLLDMYVHDNIIESRCYSTVAGNWYYALHKNQIEDDKQYVVVLDLEGAKKIKKHFGDRVHTIFIDADEKTRQWRAEASRADFNMLEWCRRLADDNEKFSPDKIGEICEFHVKNEDIVDATLELLKIVKLVTNTNESKLDETKSRVPDDVNPFDEEHRYIYTNNSISKDEFRELLKDGEAVNAIS